MGSLRFIRDNARFLLAGFLLMLTSSYGQTFFISIFSPQIMRDFSLDDGTWGGLYTVGTSASAVLMFFAGTLTDRFRVRLLAPFVMGGLALTCLAMSLAEGWVALVVIIFCLRFFGQGMTFQLAAVAMARWFVARRGLALSVSSMGFALGQAAFPVVFASLLLVYDWRGLWMLAAVLVAFTYPFIHWLLSQERTPQSLTENVQSTGMNSRHWTRTEVLGSSFFWMLVPMLLGPPAWGTSLFFQQMHIAAVKGWPAVQYLAFIPVMTAISVLVTLVTGQLVDRFGSGMLFRLFPVPWIGGFLILSLAESLAGAGLAFALFGFATGMQATLITAFWAEYFGTRYIGAIKATSTSLMVFGSAIGPGISGLLINLGYPFPDQMLGISLYFLLAMILVWIAVGKAQQKLPGPAKIDIERA